MINLLEKSWIYQALQSLITNQFSGFIRRFDSFTPPGWGFSDFHPVHGLPPAPARGYILSPFAAGQFKCMVISESVCRISLGLISANAVKIGWRRLEERTTSRLHERAPTVRQSLGGGARPRLRAPKLQRSTRRGCAGASPR